MELEQNNSLTPVLDDDDDKQFEVFPLDFRKSVCYQAFKQVRISEYFNA